MGLSKFYEKSTCGILQVFCTELQQNELLKLAWLNFCEISRFEVFGPDWAKISPKWGFSSFIKKSVHGHSWFSAWCYSSVNKIPANDLLDMTFFWEPYKIVGENFPGGTSSTVVENIDQLLKEYPDDLIIHAATNDLTNNVKLLNNLEKIVKQVSREVPSTNPAFSSFIVTEGQNGIKIYQKRTLPWKIFVYRNVLTLSTIKI